MGLAFVWLILATVILLSLFGVKGMTDLGMAAMGAFLGALSINVIGVTALLVFASLDYQWIARAREEQEREEEREEQDRCRRLKRKAGTLNRQD